jgi:hypothetical protein
MKNNSPMNNRTTIVRSQPSLDMGPDNSPEFSRLDGPVPDGSRGVLENTLRWEDDGGPVSEAGDPLPQLAENNTPQAMDAPRVGLS